MAENEVSKRDQTLSIESIDQDYLANMIWDGWRNSSNETEAFLSRQELFEEAWRDLTASDLSGPWENSANFKVPMILTYGKATHARLWQLFSAPSGFYSVQARQELFKDKELKIKEFMDYIIDSYCNGKNGARREFDRWLWDVVFKGSGFIKCYWKKDERTYKEVVPKVTIEEERIFDSSTPTGRIDLKTKVEESEEMRTEVLDTPQIRRILWEDVRLPIGQPDPQESDWVATKVYMTDDDLKMKVKYGIFDEESVQESIQLKEYVMSSDDTSAQIKNRRANIDGTSPQMTDFDGERHIVIEWYGKAYIKKEVNDASELDQDLSEFPQEVVAWVHQGSKKVLGWTYLARISPSGLRPIFKADYVSFPDRAYGVGIAELLYENQRYTDAVSNMRFDSGMLASTPMGFFRSASGLKPGQIRIKPGQLYPLDDVNDVRFFQFPFLQGFGYQEEAQRMQYAERLIAISELQLGRAPERVGALRNATGSNLLATESGIQLEIHFDRIATTLSKLLNFLFKLCRERIPETLYYRVTGERGQPVFGVIRSRDELRGDFDFKISVDILGQTQLEKQQQSVMIMQTLMNPAFTQTGVVTPTNLYELASNFLKAHKIGRVDQYVTPPPEYTGPVVTPEERIFRLVAGVIEGVEDTVQLQENHEKALKSYDAFEQSDLVGVLTPEALQALNRIRQRHQELMAAQMAGGNPNLSGMQVPRGGFGAVEAAIGGGGEAALTPEVIGEANGPVV